jgi:rubrerythrin
MAESKESLVHMLSKQKDLELEAAESLSSIVDMSRSNVVKLLLLGIVQDSKKHAQILESLIGLIKTPTFGDVEKFEIATGVEKHIKIEEEMEKTMSDIIQRVDDKEVKAILGQIVAEEKRHHQSLIELKELMGHAKRINEDEIWDYLNRWSNFST